MALSVDDGMASAAVSACLPAALYASSASVRHHFFATLPTMEQNAINAGSSIESVGKFILLLIFLHALSLSLCTLCTALIGKKVLTPKHFGGAAAGHSGTYCKNIASLLPSFSLYLALCSWSALDVALMFQLRLLLFLPSKLKVCWWSLPPCVWCASDIHTHSFRLRVKEST